MKRFSVALALVVLLCGEAPQLRADFIPAGLQPGDTYQLIFVRLLHLRDFNVPHSAARLSEFRRRRRGRLDRDL